MFPIVGNKRKKTYQTYLDFSSLWLQADKPAISLPSRGNVPLAVPRVRIQILENGSRMIIMQRRLPQTYFDSNAKLALYIAREINGYTARIKMGEKRGGTILLITSADGNLIYIDQDCLAQSRVMENVVLA
ncbi:hypothetical protein [Sodalis sp. (in: enterobacteria)]|uniref:hypothetical protein n=1 Tax=Sodalis sp. (in: enterobacteria) TaxID=1898979 RepID=UPI003F685F80